MLLFRWCVHINRISYHSSEIAVEMILLVLCNSDSVDNNSSIKVGLFKLQCSSEWRELIVNTNATRDSKIYHDGPSFLTCHINNNQRMTKIVSFTINLKLTSLFPSLHLCKDQAGNTRVLLKSSICFCSDSFIYLEISKGTLILYRIYNYLTKRE